LLIKAHVFDGIEKFFEVILNGIRVRTNREDLQQVCIRAEIETWENVSLVLQVVLKLVGALFQSLLETTKLALKDIVLAASDYVLLFGCPLHDLEPFLVDRSESLALRGHLLSNISRGEYRHQVAPRSLHSQPLLNGISGISELANLFGDDCLEGSDVSHGIHLVQGHDVLVKLVLNVLNVATEDAGHCDVLPGSDIKLSVLPELTDLALQLLLQLELLISRISDVFDIFLEGQERSLKELVQGERLTSVGNVLYVGQRNNILPMPWPDRWLGEGFY